MVRVDRPTEVEDQHEQQDEHREDERELGQALAALSAAANASRFRTSIEDAHETQVPPTRVCDLIVQGSPPVGLNVRWEPMKPAPVQVPIARFVEVLTKLGTLHGGGGGGADGGT